MSLIKKLYNLPKKQNPSKKKNVQNTNQNQTKKTQKRRRNRGRRQNKGFAGVNTRNQPFSAITGNQQLRGKMERKRVSFTEELGSVSGSVAFANTAYSMNPGQAGTFPWLALEAKQWEKYSFVKCTFQYTPSVTEFSANGVGNLVFSFDSDASDPPPNDLVHALNVNPRSFSLPCKNIALDIDPRIMNTRTDGFFVRPGGLPGGTDIKTYDCGNFNISTVGQTNTDPIGVLCVKYIVDFFIPILEPTSGAPVNNSASLFESTTTEASGATTVATQILFATATVNGCKITNTAGSFLLPAGNYIFDCGMIVTCSGTTLDSVSVRYYKDSSPIIVGTHPVNLNNTVTSPIASSTLSYSGYVSSDGTNAVTVEVQNVYSAGTVTNQGSIRFLSI